MIIEIIVVLLLIWGMIGVVNAMISEQSFILLMNYLKKLELKKKSFLKD